MSSEHPATAFPPWETLLSTPLFMLRRAGRFIVADLQSPHRVLSTSAQNGGQRDDLRVLLNHQSCEGAGHRGRHVSIIDAGGETYHADVCGEAGVPAAVTAMMGTAANMNYASIVTKTDADVAVTAVVTAGVEGNAVCGGDPAHWRETDAGLEKASRYAGTINTMLVVSVPLSAGAMARAVVTMTEGKSAALQRLAVPSRQSQDLATGTGTDQYCLAAPLGGAKARTSTSQHTTLGEIIGLAAREATMEALRWQNGLEPSYTRGLFHALGRYGVREATFFDDIAPYLSGADLELLQKNGKSVFYEPLSGAAAHALATVLDRTRHGALPEAVRREAVVQHAATLASAIAAQPARWAEFRSQLHAIGTDDPRQLVIQAVAFGWAAKWR